MNTNEFIDKLSREELREFIAYCTDIYDNKFGDQDAKDKMQQMKDKFMSLKKRTVRDNYEYQLSQLGPTGHGDICMSDADDGL